MDQKEIIDGLKSGDKIQRSSLAKQIAGIDLKAFQHVIGSISIEVDKSSSSNNFVSSLKNTITIPQIDLEEYKSISRFSNEWTTGLELIRHSKAAVVLIRDRQSNLETSSEANVSLELQIQKVIENISNLIEMEGNDATIPFVIICAADEVEMLQNYLLNNGYFGLNSQKVWILEEAKLPIISVPDGELRKKILFKSPHEIIEGPMGSGGVLRLLSCYNLVDAFKETNVQYVQICSWDNRSTAGHPLILGTVASIGADVGFKLSRHAETDGSCDVIISMDHLQEMTKDISHLQFDVCLEQHPHTQRVSGKWAAISPEEPNALRLRCNIYDCLRACLPEKTCLVQIVE